MSNKYSYQVTTMPLERFDPEWDHYGYKQQQGYESPNKHLESMASQGWRLISEMVVGKQMIYHWEYDYGEERTKNK